MNLELFIFNRVFCCTTYYVKGAALQERENFNFIFIVFSIPKRMRYLFAENVGIFIEGLEEIIEDLKMKGRSQQASPLSPMVS